MASEHHIGRSAARTGVVTGLSRIAGLGRVLVISAVLGTTYLGNTFQSSNAVSNILFELLAAGGLSAVLVPALVRVANDNERTERLSNGVLGVASVLLGGLTVIGVLGAPWIARALTAGAPQSIQADQRALATFLVRWFVPQIVLYGFGAIATAILHSRKRYAVVAAAPIANTLIMIVCFGAFRWHAGSNPGLQLDTTSKLLLAAAGSGGVLAFVAALVVPVRRLGIRLQPRIGYRDREVRDLLRHSGWGILLNSITGLLAGALVVAGNVVAGGVVAFQLAFVLFLAPYAILSQPLASVSLPELTQGANDADTSRFSRTLHWTMETMCALMAPATAVILIFARPGLLGLGLGLDRRGVLLVAAALSGLAIGLVPYSAFLVMARAHFAINDSRTPALVSLLCGAVGVLVIIVARSTVDERALVGSLGIAHSVAFATGAVILAVTMYRKSGQVVMTQRAWLPLSVAASIGVPTWLLSTTMHFNGRSQLLAYSAGGTALYLLVYALVLKALHFGSVNTRPAADFTG